MKIKLSKDVSLDLDEAIESRILVQANSGGGKSYTLRRFIEQAFGHKQLIIIDPEGEFGNMRTKFDFVYIAKDGGDAPAEPRSAALLARKLLETKANAVIDIYELGTDRHEFVKNFMTALVNMPKDLWTDCFIILDEAHKFAPEKGQGESIALGSVIDMASLGRKRGYCLIAATQRPAKLSKDVVAECNNKIIGRASLDIDRKRSAEELGFNTKEEALSLRNLQPGEFYVFGPAISNEVIKTTIGDVQVKPPKRGTGRSLKIAPPSAKVKAILAELKDLPQEAAKEARTAKELKEALTVARRQITVLQRGAKQQTIDPDVLKKAYGLGVAAVEHTMRKDIKKVQEGASADIKRTLDILQKIARLTQPFINAGIGFEAPKFKPVEIAPPVHMPGRDAKSQNYPRGGYEPNVFRPRPAEDFEGEQKPLSKGARLVLSYLAQVHPHWKSKAQLWVATGYAPGGGFSNLISELITSGFIEKDGMGKYAFVDSEESRQQVDPSFDPSLTKWDSKLSTGALKVFKLLLASPDEQFDKEYIAQETGYALGGGFSNLISELKSKELIIKTGSGYTINPEILDL